MWSKQKRAPTESIRQNRSRWIFHWFFTAITVRMKAYTIGYVHNPYLCNFLQSFYQSSLLPPANEVWGKVIFSEACVKNSVHRGGVSTSVHAPRSRHPPGADIPLEQTPLWSRHPREQAPPHRACWEIRSKRGRYASYWNVVLLRKLASETFRQNYLYFFTWLDLSGTFDP